jgi:inner membrane protein
MVFILVPLWIASLVVNSTISEREGVRDGAEREISEKWGNDQVLAGPVLVLPWTEYQTVHYEDTKGVSRTRVEAHLRTANFLPESFDIDGDLKPELRKRGIFETVLYVADLKVKGSFAVSDLRSLGIDPAAVRWNDAFLSVGISDPRGIRDDVKLDWDGAKLAFKPGPGQNAPFEHGFHAAAPPLAGKKRADFSFTLSLNGSRTLQIAPVGRRTEAKLRSSWPDPSFNGEYLPGTRDVSPQGFTAQWTVLELARDFPQAWIAPAVGGEELIKASFGVGLVKTASTYQQSARATKYAILFLLLTFSFFFLFEVIGDLKVHPVQYLLVGAALVVFYLLLLSVSEHVGFNAAYILSTLATLGILWGYVKAILKEPKRAKMLIATLAGLYAYLFVILRLNDYALLMGSLGIFAALAALMYLTRNIDWYALDKAPKD